MKPRQVNDKFKFKKKHAKLRAKIDYQKRIATICQQRGIQARHYNHHMHPFCWNVKLPWSFNFDEIFKEMVKHHYLSYAEAILDIRDIPKFKEQWAREAEDRYNMAIQDMGNYFTEEGEGHTSRMLRPHLERKYHIKCPDRGFDVEFEQMGRSGGWLVMTRFEGIKFSAITVSVDHLYMELDDVGHDGDLYRRKLCAYLEECCLMLGDNVRKEELLYQLAFQMHCMVD